MVSTLDAFSRRVRRATVHTSDLMCQRFSDRRRFGLNATARLVLICCSLIFLMVVAMQRPLSRSTAEHRSASASLLHPDSPPRRRLSPASSYTNVTASTIDLRREDQKRGIVSRRLGSHNTAHGTDANHDKVEEEDALIESYISFFLCSFLAAAALQWLVSHVTVYNVPISVIWFLFGMVLDIALVWTHVNKPPDATVQPLLVAGVMSIGKMNAEIVYLVFLPILLYEACLNIDWHKFKRFALSGICLAVFGVAYQVAVVGCLVQITFGVSTNQWSNSFLFAAAMASTDPVAVISVLNGLQAPGKLASMFEGESLINDGSSMLLFQFFKSLSRGDVETWDGILTRLVLLLFAAPVWGVVCGFLVYAWVRHFRRFPDMQVLTWISGGYAVYFVGEKYLHTSGPIAIVCYGLFYVAFGHIGLDHDAHEQHHHSVRALGTLANSSVFVIAGVVAARMIIEAIAAKNGLDTMLLWDIPVLYLYLLLARMTMVILFLPVLKRTGYGVNWKEVVLLVWGGLRGAIVLAMGLMIEQDHQILSVMRYTAVLYIAGNTLLILLINGVTFELLFKLLNPYPPKPFRRVYLERVMKMIDHQYSVEKRVLEDHWLFRGTGILEYANRAVPLLGWRRMNARGKIDFKLPSVSAAFSDLPACDKLTSPADVSKTVSPPHTVRGDHDTDGERPPVSGPSIAFSKPDDGNVRPDAGSTESVAGPTQSTTDDESAEQRAHDAAASVFGLRDAREAEGSFDARLYLRLLEHVTEPIPEEEVAAIDSPLLESRRSSVGSKSTTPGATGEDRHPKGGGSVGKGGGREGRLGALSVPRADTDETIIFPDFVPPEGPVARPQTHRVRPVRSASSGLGHRNVDAPDRNTAMPSAPRRPRFQVFGPDTQITEKPTGESTNFTHSVDHGAVPPMSQPHVFTVPKMSVIDRSTEIDHTTEQRLLQPSRFVPRISSEPFGSSRLDGARMTRLRLPEWDSRQSVDDLMMLRRRIPLPNEYGYGEQRVRQRMFQTPRLVSVNAEDDAVADDAQREGATSGSRGFPQSSESNSRNSRRQQLGIPVRFSDATIATPRISRVTFDHASLSSRQLHSRELHSRERRSSLRPRLRHPFKGKRDDAIHRLRWVGKTLPNALPGRIVSAPTGHLDTGCLGFDNDGTSSIDSSEEYLPIPETPSAQGQQPVSLVKVLRKEREGELYIMTFNAVRQMYRRLYQQHFIGGTAMLSLNAVLDVATDFAIGKLKRNPIKAWRDVLKDMEFQDEPVDREVEVTEGMTGFEFEWKALACRLRCFGHRHRHKRARRLFGALQESHWVKATITYPAAVVDLQLVTAYVDVHEELLWKGGLSLEDLLGPRLLSSYRRQVFEAKRFVAFIQESYPKSFPYALAVHGATLLVNLKQMLVEEQAQKGLILQEDCENLLHLFEEQHQNLASFTPFKWRWSWLWCAPLWLSRQRRQQQTQPPVSTPTKNVPPLAQDGGGSGTTTFSSCKSTSTILDHFLNTKKLALATKPNDNNQA